MTVREVMELLEKCNPDAVIMLALVEDDYSENATFIEECNEREVYFCDKKPEERPRLEDYLDNKSDYWIEVISETDNFAQIKINAVVPNLVA